MDWKFGVKWKIREKVEGSSGKKKHYPQQKNEFVSVAAPSFIPKTARTRTQMERALHKPFQSCNGIILYSNSNLCSCMKIKTKTFFFYFFFFFFWEYYTIGFWFLVAQLKEQEQQSQIINWENQEEMCQSAF